MPVQIAGAILEVEQRAAAGESIEAIAAELGISASTYHRWRSLYHGLNADDIAYTKRLESEVRRLRKIISELEMDAPLPGRTAEAGVGVAGRGANHHVRAG